MTGSGPLAVRELGAWQALRLISNRPFHANDRVSVRDGRLGRIVGFYLREPPVVLVLFDSGERCEIEPEKLRRLN